MLDQVLVAGTQQHVHTHRVEMVVREFANLVDVKAGFTRRGCVPGLGFLRAVVGLDLNCRFLVILL